MYDMSWVSIKIIVNVYSKQLAYASERLSFVNYGIITRGSCAKVGRQPENLLCTDCCL